MKLINDLAEGDAIPGHCFTDGWYLIRTRRSTSSINMGIYQVANGIGTLRYTTSHYCKEWDFRTIGHSTQLTDIYQMSFEEAMLEMI